MLRLLGILVPLGLAAAVSPVMLTEQTVLVAGPNGRRTATLYAAGTVAVVLLFVGAVVTVGRTLSLPTAPHLDATLDVAIGLLLVALAGALRRRAPNEPRRREVKGMRPAAAFGFGVVSMATNVTTLAIVVPAAKEIAASSVDAIGRLVAGALLVALACLPGWAPVAMISLAPSTMGDVLARLDALVQRNGRRAAVLLLAAAGAFLVVRGFVRLAVR